MELTPYLRLMVQRNGSDLYFSTGAAPHVKISGQTMAIGDKKLAPGEVSRLAYSILNDEQIREFERTMECNLAISVQGLGRFRVNVFRQRGDTAMVLRFIKGQIPSIEELHLPQTLKKLIMAKRGLILVVGSTGSGKSTTLASMIDYRNANVTGHILSIEDPIEFLHRHKKSVVNQREIGLDSMSYESALKNALREAPDVIMIGEVRDAATMQHAISYAETGHLCLTTLHANNANQALDRIINFFPDSAHKQILNDLSMNLRAVVSQRLISSTDGNRRAAVEMLIQSAYTAELIQKGKIHDLKEAMEQGKEHGMVTFDQSLYELYVEGAITLDEALSHADSRNNLALRIRLNAPPPASQGASEQDAAVISR
ncbi:MAG: PilT/PilU family type 4a pilus ATPase [Chromatiaceae bacterium]|nr:PilT/PilU family type 4a pilus ATPase [Gammaproteobacteria bacterium]MCP5314695.1 PilT/PilU family type 4a pilus ATPase [Chromatiaceae bacterium]